MSFLLSDLLSAWVVVTRSLSPQAARRMPSPEPSTASPQASWTHGALLRGSRSHNRAARDSSSIPSCRSALTGGGAAYGSSSPCSAPAWGGGLMRRPAECGDGNEDAYLRLSAGRIQPMPLPSATNGHGATTTCSSGASAAPATSTTLGAAFTTRPGCARLSCRLD